MSDSGFEFPADDPDAEGSDGHGPGPTGTESKSGPPGGGLAAAIADLVVERPAAVVIVFLLATAGFGAGLGQVSMEGGTGQFTDASPAQDAYDAVHREFGDRYAVETGATLLIQRHENVLSKPGLLGMLDAQATIQATEDLRVAGTTSPASMVARELDPGARTLDAQRRALESASPAAVDAAVRRAAADQGFRDLVSEDLTVESARASSAIGVVHHEVPGRDETAVGVTADSAFQATQLQTREVVDTLDGDFRVFGSGIIAAEFSTIIVDSLQIVVPAATLLILVFLLVAYRDLLDFAIGLFALGTAIVWTFGIMGWAGIPFSQLLIAIPPLLLGVGIDYGIHVINGYRERAAGGDIRAAMTPTMTQLVVAFGIVTGTTVLGFSANLTSQLGPIRDFGVIAGVGVVVTFLVFGIYLPALKVLVDRARDRWFGAADPKPPIGSDGSVLEPFLTLGIAIGRRAPRAFLALALVSAGIAGYYGAGVDTSFSDEDFLPPEDIPDYVENAPGPLATQTYTVTASTNHLEAAFATDQSDSIVVYHEAPMTRDPALEAIQRAGERPPDAIATGGRRVESRSIVTVIDRYAAHSPAFADLVARNDFDGDGIPEDDLETVYDALMASPYGDEASRYLSDDYRKTVVYYGVTSDADQGEIAAAGEEIAGRLRGEATATGSTVIFHSVARLIYQSAITSLLVALGATAVFLSLLYRRLFDDWTLGLVNLLPILLTVAFVLGTMRLLGMKFNALTATLLAVTIGMGVDYSVHLVHRFVEEYETAATVTDALEPTMRGTGGALTGSMLTTTAGVGVLAIAITPILRTFGILTALSILYAYLASMLVTPSVAMLWAGHAD
jgi:predicted RND superfamily exporter protein